MQGTPFEIWVFRSLWLSIHNGPTQTFSFADDGGSAPTADTGGDAMVKYRAHIAR